MAAFIPGVMRLMLPRPTTERVQAERPLRLALIPQAQVLMAPWIWLAMSGIGWLIGMMGVIINQVRTAIPKAQPAGDIALCAAAVGSTTRTSCASRTGATAAARRAGAATLGSVALGTDYSLTLLRFMGRAMCRKGSQVSGILPSSITKAQRRLYRHIFNYIS